MNIWCPNQKDTYFGMVSGLSKYRSVAVQLWIDCPKLVLCFVHGSIMISFLASVHLGVTNHGTQPGDYRELHSLIRYSEVN